MCFYIIYHPWYTASVIDAHHASLLLHQDKEDIKFCIQHPKKSFTVSAKTVWNKKAWMSAISSASEAVLRARLEG